MPQRTYLLLATGSFYSFSVTVWSKLFYPPPGHTTSVRSVPGDISTIADGSLLADRERKQDPQTWRFFFNHNTKSLAKLPAGTEGKMDGRADDAPSIAWHVV